MLFEFKTRSLDPTARSSKAQWETFLEILTAFLIYRTSVSGSASNDNNYQRLRKHPGRKNWTTKGMAEHSKNQQTEFAFVVNESRCPDK